MVELREADEQGGAGVGRGGSPVFCAEQMQTGWREYLKFEHTLHCLVCLEVLLGWTMLSELIS